jgi:hypothetical protein
MSGQSLQARRDTACLITEFISVRYHTPLHGLRGFEARKGLLHVRPLIPFLNRFRLRREQRHVDRIEEATAGMVGRNRVLMMMGQGERFINDFRGGSAEWAGQEFFHK